MLKFSFPKSMLIIMVVHIDKLLCHNYLLGTKSHLISTNVRGLSLVIVQSIWMKFIQLKKSRGILHGG